MPISTAKKIISIALDWTRPKDPPLSLGQAAIIANLKEKNIPYVSHAWSVNNKTFDPKEVIQFIRQHQSPGVIVGIGGFIWNEIALQTILSTLKNEEFPGLTLLGGPQISYTKNSLENIYPNVDIFIRGYAEDAIVSLFQANDPMKTKPIIRGVHYAHEPDRGLSSIIDFDNLPSPYLTGLIAPQSFIRWETQRGCPFKCSFCQHRESSPLKERRSFSLSRIMQEAQWITNNPIIQDIAVVDPIFNAGPNYLQILNTLADGNYSGKLALQCRAEMVTPEFLTAVERVNKHGHVVLEFGLQTIHVNEQKHIDRSNNMRKISRILTEISAKNIYSEISLIFGLPGQTPTSFHESIQFCINHKVPIIHAFPLMLLRGTLLHDRKNELGLIESSKEKAHHLPRVQEDIPHVISSPSFSYEDWKQMAKMAEWLEEHYNKQAQSSSVLRFSSAPFFNKQSFSSEELYLKKLMPR